MIYDTFNNNNNIFSYGINRARTLLTALYTNFYFKDYLLITFGNKPYHYELKGEIQ